MIIKKIEIENFKLFKESKFKFDKNFNLIIGINGSGKTSLLRAISVSLGGWANAYIKDDNNLRSIEDNEVREIQIDKRFDKSKITSITAHIDTIIIDDHDNKKSIEAECVRSRTEEKPDTDTYCNVKYSNYPKWYSYSSFSTLGFQTLSYIENKNKFNLPLIAVYECDRLWIKENELSEEKSAKAKYSRFDPYLDCFHTGADHNAIGEWLLKHEMVSLKKGKKTPILQSIKNAAINALEDCTDISFDFEEGRVIVDFENKDSMPFEHLSDGQRTILGLFCDIARRAAILNPHLEGEANEKTKGIVLIDELDLHLHPKWQMNIVENLRIVFPNIQFICTTHSPILLRSIDKKNIIIMKEGEQLNETIFSKGRDINSILYDFMGVPKRTEEYENMIDNLFGYLDDENIEKSEKLLKKLEKDYGKKDSIVIEAKLILKMIKE